MNSCCQCLNTDITGIKLWDREFKISLSADDVLLTLTNLHPTLPNLHVELPTVSVLSWYKINISNTIALPLSCSLSALTSLRSNFSYQWRDSSLKYLGIYLIPSYASLFSYNYPILFDEIHRLLNKWNTLPISFLDKSQL